MSGTSSLFSARSLLNPSRRMLNSDLYADLGVPRTATQDEIKRAYRKHAMASHPDRFPEPEKKKAAEEKFKKISAAYSVLSDADKRQKYDQFGAAGMDAGGPSGFGGVDASELFARMFGERGGPFGGGPSRPQAAEPIVQELNVSLEDIFNGRTIRTRIRRERHCTPCGGSGTRDGRPAPTCEKCKGRGHVVEMRTVSGNFVQAVQSTCPKCRGDGCMTEPSNVCTSCRGAKVVNEEKTLEVTIPPGIESGMALSFPGEGSQVSGSKHASDVMIVIKVAQHRTFKRLGPQGRHLLVRKGIKLADALAGAHTDVVHLDGRTLTVTPPTGTVIAPGSKWTIPGEGFPILDGNGIPTGRRGELVVEFEVLFPRRLNEAQVAALRKVFDLPTTPPTPGGPVVELSPCQLSEYELRETSNESRQRQQERPRSPFEEAGFMGGMGGMPNMGGARVQGCPQQ